MHYIMSKFIVYGDRLMHNLISYNQLAGEESFNPDNDLIADYYECLIECDDSQSVCKRICKEVLI